MVKTPEEYFQNADFSDPSIVENPNLTTSEKSFIDKYMGADETRALNLPSTPALNLPSTPAADLPEPEIEVALTMQEELIDEEQIQMVSFVVDSQIYTIPIIAVQEVIRFMEPTLLPMAPPFVAGVINLRGRVTPLLHLDQLVTTSSRHRNEEQFIIVCIRKGLQVGLAIDRVHSMYFVKQSKIIWNIEAQIGSSADYLCGIVDIDDKIFGIISVDMIIDHVLES